MQIVLDEVLLAARSVRPAAGNVTIVMPSEGWTLSTLKTVVESEIAALGRVTDARFVAGDASAAESKEAIKVGLAAAQTALAAAAALAKEAVTEAKAAHAAEHAALAMALALAMLELKERLAEMNNFRAQMADERGDFVTRDRLASAIATVEVTMTALISALAAQVTLSSSKIVHMEASFAASEVDVSALKATQTIGMNRLGAIETEMANLKGRITAYSTALGVGFVLFELFLRYFVK